MLTMAMKLQSREFQARRYKEAVRALKGRWVSQWKHGLHWCMGLVADTSQVLHEYCALRRITGTGKLSFTWGSLPSRGSSLHVVKGGADICPQRRICVHLHTCLLASLTRQPTLLHTSKHIHEHTHLSTNSGARAGWWRRRRSWHSGTPTSHSCRRACPRRTCSRSTGRSCRSGGCDLELRSLRAPQPARTSAPGAYAPRHVPPKRCGKQAACGSCSDPG